MVRRRPGLPVARVRFRVPAGRRGDAREAAGGNSQTRRIAALGLPPPCRCDAAAQRAPPALAATAGVWHRRRRCYCSRPSVLLPTNRPRLACRPQGSCCSSPSTAPDHNSAYPGGPQGYAATGPSSYPPAQSKPKPGHYNTAPAMYPGAAHGYPAGGHSGYMAPSYSQPSYPPPEYNMAPAQSYPGAYPQPGGYPPPGAYQQPGGYQQQPYGYPPPVGAMPPQGAHRSTLDCQHAWQPSQGHLPLTQPRDTCHSPDFLATTHAGYYPQQQQQGRYGRRPGMGAGGAAMLGGGAGLLGGLLIADMMTPDCGGGDCGGGECAARAACFSLLAAAGSARSALCGASGRCARQRSDAARGKPAGMVATLLMRLTAAWHSFLLLIYALCRRWWRRRVSPNPIPSAWSEAALSDPSA